MIDSCLGERRAADSAFTVRKSTEVSGCFMEIWLAVYIYSISFIMSGMGLNILLGSLYFNCRLFRMLN